MVWVRDKIFGFDAFLPDFRLTRPAEMHKNPNHARHDPTSIVVPMIERFPVQPPMPAYHPAMVEEIRLRLAEAGVPDEDILDESFHGY